jgi:hypothetical protein
LLTEELSLVEEATAAQEANLAQEHFRALLRTYLEQPEVVEALQLLCQEQLSSTILWAISGVEEAAAGAGAELEQTHLQDQEDRPEPILQHFLEEEVAVVVAA